MKRLILTLSSLLIAFLVQAQCNVSFTTSVSGLTVTATNTSAFSLVPGSTPMVWYTWGDNSSSPASYQPTSTVSHTYGASGTYLVILNTIYFDTLNNVMLCNDTVSTYVSVTSPCVSTISLVDNGNGDYSFTANNSNPGMTYDWNFGDGSATVSGANVNHTYTSSGNFTVTLTTTGGGATCTTSTMVSYFNGTLDCSQLQAQFSYSVANGVVVSFVNTSTPTSIPLSAVSVASWDFGDGNTSSLSNPVHVYTSAGTYNVSLVNVWMDSLTNNVLCTDTAVQQVTVTTPPNIITGNITWDSANNVLQSSFKVWLISFDSTTNMISAVDSVITSGALYQTSYSFSNHPAGIYRTKAAVLNGAAGASNMAPTYHAASTYWGSATLIYHTGATSANKHIHMQSGTSTSGPGFIAGNVTLGAGKGTNAGVPHLLVILRDDNNQMVRFTYTDVNGDYSFGNLAAGTYNVYPENMPQITTPSGTINLVSGAYNVSGINFEKTSTEIKPITTGINDLITPSLFSIYPNPANNMVTIKWNSSATGKANIRIMDITGREVYSATANTNTTTNIQLEAMPSGVYFIKIASEKMQHTEKLVIRK